MTWRPENEAARRGRFAVPPRAPAGGTAGAAAAAGTAATAGTDAAAGVGGVSGAARRTRRRLTVHHGAVAALTLAAAAAYAGYGLVLQATLRTTTYDQVIFDQAVRSYAHFQPGISIAKGLHNGGGPHFSVLGDHWSPILAVLAPLYWLASDPRTLLVAQGAAFAAAAPLIWRFARRRARTRLPGRAATAVAYLAAATYLLSWPVAEAVAFGFHEVAFVPVLTAAFFERMDAGKPRAALLAAAGLLLVKEDMGLLVAGFGLWLLVTSAGVRARRLTAAAMLAGGFAATCLAALVLRPAFGGSAMYYWRYGALGSDVSQAALHMVSHPVATARLLVTPHVKLATMAWLTGALLFLPLCSPITLAAVPLLAERMLASSAPDWWGLPFQYNAFIVVVLVCAAVDGALCLGGWFTRLHGRWWGGHWWGRGDGRPRPAGGAVWLAGMCCAATVALVPFFPLGVALHPGFYRQTPGERAAAAATAAVPSGVTVEATNMAGPQLSARDTVLLWDRAPRWAPWVVADTARPVFPFPSLWAQRQRVRLLLSRGYRVTFARDGYLVLHRRA